MARPRRSGPGHGGAAWLALPLWALLAATSFSGCDRPRDPQAPSAETPVLHPTPDSRTQAGAQLLLSPTSPQIGQGTAQVFTLRSLLPDGHVRDVTQKARFIVTQPSGEPVAEAPDGIVSLSQPGRYQVTAELDGGRIVTPIVVTAAAIRSVTVTPSLPNVAKGLTQQFKATATMTDGSTQDVTSVASWSVRNTSGSDVATVNSAGLATAKNVGKARISARYMLTSGSTTMEVTPAAIKTLSIAPLNPTIAKGTSRSFTATGQFTDGTMQDLTTQVDWAVRDVMGSGVASIDETGTVVGDSVGQAAVSAEFQGVVTETTLTVTPAVVVGLSISPLTPSIPKGMTQRFKATASLSDGSSQDVSAVASWLALDVTGSGVASVDASGLATGNSVGVANIGCAYRGFAATTTLDVKPAILVSVALSPSTASIAKGRTQRFQLVGSYSDGSSVDVSASSLWQVSDVMGSDVAAIDAGGRALGKNPGQARIQAEHMGKSASALLTVGPAVLSEVTLSPGGASIAIGASQTFKLSGVFSDGTTQDLSSLAMWSISDIAPAMGVATISSGGVATGKAKGHATVTATYSTFRATASLSVGMARGVCSASGWCWKNPLPQGNYMPSVWAADASNAWAVSDLGLILRWNGSTWDPVPSGTTQNLLSIWGLDRNNIWAVGVGGVIVKWNGTSWAVQSSGTTQSLSAVWGWDANNVWAAGAGGTILKWDGSAWTAQASGSVAYLRGIFGTSARSVWIVGQSGTILKWDGSAWTAQASSSIAYLRGIWGTDDKNLWAAGDISPIGSIGVVLRWDGTTWKADPAFPPRVSIRMRGIWGLDASRIVVVGDSGALLQWNGSVWTEVPSGTTSNLNGVSGTGGGPIWAVGDRGSIVKWSFGGTATPSSSGSLTGITSVWGSDASHIWFVGYSGQILFWNGTRLEAQASGTTQSLTDVWGTDARNVWATGANGTLLRFNGTAWSPVSSGTTQVLNSVFGTSANNVWFVGYAGTIVRWDGSAVTAVTSPVTQYLTSVWGSAADDVWVVGFGGTILRWNGTSVTQQMSGTTSDLSRVLGTSKNSVWAVGYSGRILFWNGSMWTAQTSGTTQFLQSIWAESASNVWVSGDGGTLLQWNGSTWTPRASGASSMLFGLWGSGANNIWAAGANGTILHYAP
ncbi:MAG: Ig-like domain-containing protein [Myxococcales bacterium]|nr:Ig-like domain-containing protein [Myxococcales bacterium]